jgi:hypothetical protein
LQSVGFQNKSALQAFPRGFPAQRRPELFRMPDHFHLLVKPEPAASTSRSMNGLSVLSMDGLA